KATNGSERPRLFATGSYAYFQTDDAEVIADNSAAAATELVIATYTGAGTNLVITPTQTKWQNLEDAITAAFGYEMTRAENAEAAEATVRENAVGAETNAHITAINAINLTLQNTVQHIILHETNGFTPPYIFPNIPLNKLTRVSMCIPANKARILYFLSGTFSVCTLPPPHTHNFHRSYYKVRR
ncbi:MAG: hypothetical protein LBK25_04735, partial [Treponema sp.]|nr:hypothetical protein [Treponema sp.]